MYSNPFSFSETIEPFDWKALSITVSNHSVIWVWLELGMIQGVGWTLVGDADRFSGAPFLELSRKRERGCLSVC